MKFFKLKPKPKDNPIFEYLDYATNRANIIYAILIIAGMGIFLLSEIFCK